MLSQAGVEMCTYLHTLYIITSLEKMNFSTYENDPRAAAGFSTILFS